MTATRGWDINVPDIEPLDPTLMRRAAVALVRLAGCADSPELRDALEAIGYLDYPRVDGSREAKDNRRRARNRR